MGKRLFLVSLLIVFLSRALTWHESISLPHTAIYVVFIIGWGIPAFLQTIAIKKRISLGSVILVLLGLYFLFFGLYNIADLDRESTLEELIRSILMISFLLVAKYWILKYRAINQSIKVFYFSLALLMLTLFVAYFNDINLAKSIASFWQSNAELRYRNNFGFFANNIAGEYSVSVILLSIFLFKQNRGHRMFKFFLLLVDLIMLVIIIANDSRGSLMALLFVLLLLFVSWARRHIRKKGIKKLLFVSAIVGFSIAVVFVSTNAALIENLLLKSNRFHFLDNIAALNAGQKEWFGLGTISGSYFQEGHILYGKKLNFMEMFYVGVFVKTGIVGSIFIATIIFIIFACLVKSVRESSSPRKKKWFLMVFFYMLFVSFFEEYLFSHSYVTSTFYLLSLLSFIDASRKIRGIRKKANSLLKKPQLRGLLYGITQ